MLDLFCSDQEQCGSICRCGGKVAMRAVDRNGTNLSGPPRAANKHNRDLGLSSWVFTSERPEDATSPLLQRVSSCKSTHDRIKSRLVQSLLKKKWGTNRKLPARRIARSSPFCHDRALTPRPSTKGVLATSMKARQPFKRRDVRPISGFDGWP